MNGARENPATPRPTRILTALSCIVFAVCTPAAVMAKVPPKAGSTIGTKTVAPPTTLKPGEYIWHPEASPSGPMVMVVSLTEQTAYVYRNGVLIGASTVSTGKQGHETPTGVFTVLQKNADHYSNIYNNAPMPYMQRLTWSGIALHAGKLPGYPASHGCVRMPYDFAKLLFAESSTGITVVVSSEKEFPSTVAHPGLFSPIDLGGKAAIEPDHEGKTFAWQSEVAAAGPVSILITGEDRRIRVFRNGVQIGWSLYALDDPTRKLSLHVLTALDRDAGAPPAFSSGPPAVRWQVVSGSAETSVTTDRLLSGVQVPEDFLRALSAEVTPGTTLVFTQLAASGATTGTELAVVTAEEPVAVP